MTWRWARLQLPGAATAQVAEDLRRAMRAPGGDLATAALTIARIEYPTLDRDRYLRMLERMGDEAAARLGGPRRAKTRSAR